MDERVKLKRNRIKPAGSLEERLQRFADQAKTAASLAPPGPERDALIAKVKNAELAAAAAQRLGE
ncbi:hypothetical protein [Bradyrhizobium lablabi]|uniref:hypothetical protein n=1 Tax=Bradyrhizobium lablabi TaxID=722472 RepID=UPI00090C5504|nr:hypothetical protein [Bradyrhizobium lablabi]SHK69646.1 hypothetical protein SAMN05444321_0369 [Bradyrhizobium lablabi]